tara:strand:+ start:275 stop:394 length:120 start_codon:yes stop_codon:yes gene_type:complete
MGESDEGLYPWLAKVKAGDRSVVTALAEKTREGWGAAGR